MDSLFNATGSRKQCMGTKASKFVDLVMHMDVSHLITFVLLE